MKEADLNSMFGIVKPGSREAERNLANQSRVAEDTRRKLPIWERPDPNRRRYAGIVRAKRGGGR